MSQVDMRKFPVLGPTLFWHDFDLEERRAVIASGVTRIERYISRGVQSKAYVATDRHGNQVCLKLTKVQTGPGAYYHAQWHKSWGKRSFDCPILDTGYVWLGKGTTRRLRWVIQPLGRKLTRSEYKEICLEMDSESEYVIPADTGSRQWAVIKWQGQERTVLVDYASYIDVRHDLTKIDSQRFWRFKGEYESALEDDDSYRAWVSPSEHVKRVYATKGGHTSNTKYNIAVRHYGETSSDGYDDGECMRTDQLPTLTANFDYEAAGAMARITA